jgi:hypothetical protein
MACQVDLAGVDTSIEPIVKNVMPGTCDCDGKKEEIAST